MIDSIRSRSSTSECGCFDLKTARRRSFGFRGPAAPTNPRGSDLRSPRAEAALDARGITRMSIFGSTARGENRTDSDIDNLIEVSSDTCMSLTGFVRLKSDLAEILGHPVYLAEWLNLYPRFAASAERDAVAVF
ncbi:nucleotidyltransferase domain-containing protein [Methylobacterium brachiatum]|nr:MULTISPECIES: nucleotidyltransferase domain-containing protein [Methylobacterium]MDH2314097.1 nucleotidyltransferase domain-containing protein [Methylobacterium brachiatum]